MSIHLHLENLAFGPEEIGQMQEAYEKTLHELGLVDRTDPLTEIVAKKIIEIIQTGEREPAAITRCALSELRILSLPLDAVIDLSASYP